MKDNLDGKGVKLDNLLCVMLEMSKNRQVTVFNICEVVLLIWNMCYRWIWECTLYNTTRLEIIFGIFFSIHKWFIS